MCGIVGHLGSKESIGVVLKGLERLEYRGYDSAGICFKGVNGHLELYKKTGKLENLKKVLGEVKIKSTSCIGHTRWATHGEVNDRNAHPHLSDSIAIDNKNSVAIVHNGIIENAEELRQEIVSKGLSFISETDSEVFLALLVIHLNEGLSFIQAVIQSFKRVHGNSAFVIQIKGQDKIFAVKRGAPLVCGRNLITGDAFVSSDPYALAGFADEIFFPDDEVFCCLDISDNRVNFFDLSGAETVCKIVRQQSIEVVESSKGDFEHYMLKEIYEQPGLIRSLAAYYTSREGASILACAAEVKPKRIHVIGCGTAWHAGLLIKEFCEKIAGIPASIELASEFRYRNPLLSKNDLGIFISQSGETADTLAAQNLCKSRGMRTLSIVNVSDSTLYRDCDANLLIKAGIEIGVASTKAFSTQVLTGRLFSEALRNEINPQTINKQFNLLADRIDTLLEGSEKIKKIAEKIHSYKGFIFTGRGLDYPIALEGALKLKEIAYVHAEGYAAGELKHGPIALIDENMVNIAIVSPDLYIKTVSNIQEIKARRGIIVIVGPSQDRQLEKLSDYYIPLDYRDLGVLSVIYANVANQLLAYYMAKFKGTDIDKPRNLAKSVTVE